MLHSVLFFGCVGFKSAKKPQMSTVLSSYEQLKGVLQLIDEQVVNIYQFGSRIFGSHKPDADWDFLIITRNDQQKPTFLSLGCTEELFTPDTQRQYKKILLDRTMEDGTHVSAVCITVHVFKELLQAHNALLYVMIATLPPSFCWLQRAQVVLISWPTLAMDYSGDNWIAFSFRMRALCSHVLTEANRAWHKAFNMFAKVEQQSKAWKLIVYAFRYWYWGIQMAKHERIINFKEGTSLLAELYGLPEAEVKSRYSPLMKQLQEEFIMSAPHKSQKNVTHKIQEGALHNTQEDGSHKIQEDVHGDNKLSGNIRGENAVPVDFYMTDAQYHQAIQDLQQYLTTHSLETLVRDYSIRVVQIEEDLYQLFYDPSESPLQYDIVRLCAGLVVQIVFKKEEEEEGKAIDSQLEGKRVSVRCAPPRHVCNRFDCLDMLNHNQPLLETLLLQLVGADEEIAVEQLRKETIVGLFWHKNKWLFVPFQDWLLDEAKVVNSLWYFGSSNVRPSFEQLRKEFCDQCASHGEDILVCQQLDKQKIHMFLYNYQEGEADSCRFTVLEMQQKFRGEILRIQASSSRTKTGEFSSLNKQVLASQGQRLILKKLGILLVLPQASSWTQWKLRVLTHANCQFPNKQHFSTKFLETTLSLVRFSKLGQFQAQQTQQEDVRRLATCIPWGALLVELFAQCEQRFSALCAKLEMGITVITEKLQTVEGDRRQVVQVCNQIFGNPEDRPIRAALLRLKCFPAFPNATLARNIICICASYDEKNFVQLLDSAVNFGQAC